jgi:hypothetical protein
MRRPDVFEATRLDIVDLTDDERREILSILGPARIGRRTMWRTWSSSSDRRPGAMVRYTVFAEDAAEAMWLRYGSDRRLVDGLRNVDGSASKKFVESYTHWTDAPFAHIEPIIRWARSNLHRHHFEWGGQADRWMLWLKTPEALVAFEAEWPEHGMKPAPMFEGDDDGRLLYVHAVRQAGRHAA